MKKQIEIYRAPVAEFDFDRVQAVLQVLFVALSGGVDSLTAMAAALVREREESGATRMAIGCLVSRDDGSLAFQVPVDRKAAAQSAWEGSEPRSDAKGASA